MRSFARLATNLCILAVALGAVLARPSEAESPVSVSPAEHRIADDPETGARLVWLTTDPASDTNFYFHERSWTSSGSIILFYSARESGGLMGYVVETGELLHISTSLGGTFTGATAALSDDRVYAVHDGSIVEIALRIEPHAGSPSSAYAEVRPIGAVPPGDGVAALNESCDGQYLSVPILHPADGGDPAVYVIAVASGEARELCRIGTPPTYAYHVQWSHTNPNLLSFAGIRPRLNVVDIRTGAITNPYLELEGELVTHEHWWVDDQIVFCGGLHGKPTEDAHVKVVNVHTGTVRIIGAGSWWPEATPETISKLNYWHCAGSDDGRWVVADNWHGDITVLEAKTTRPHLLTTGHRTYGKGDHPHVGWDRASRQVIFTSHQNGNPDVCIATIPDAWQAANPSP